MRAAPQGALDAPILTFDVGGTFTRAGLFDAASGSLNAAARCDTPNFLRQPGVARDELLGRVFASIRDLGKQLLRNSEPSAVVVAYPGPMTPNGTALRAPTILGDALDGPHDAKRSIQAIWPQAHAAVLNDLTCAGYHYVAQGCEDFCVITVGSGIGNKVFLAGRPVVGGGGRGGEIGHLLVRPEYASPVADLHAELGDVASGRGTLQLARRWLERSPECFDSSLLREGIGDGGRAMDTRMLVEAFRADDPLARRIVAAGCYPIADLIGVLHLALGLESFFIVGGFAKALGPTYLQLLIERSRRITWDLGQDWTSMIELGKPNHEEALLGAGYFAASELEHAPSIRHG